MERERQRIEKKRGQTTNTGNSCKIDCCGDVGQENNRIAIYVKGQVASSSNKCAENYQTNTDNILKIFSWIIKSEPFPPK